MKEVIKIIEELDKKYFDYYSKKCVCKVNDDFAKDIGADNCWWINLDDISDFITELKERIANLKPFDNSSSKKDCYHKSCINNKDNKCIFSTDITETLSCCKDGNFDCYGFPINVCKEFPCQRTRCACCKCSSYPVRSSEQPSRAFVQTGYS